MHTCLSSEALLSPALGDRNSKISGSEGETLRPLNKQKKYHILSLILAFSLLSFFNILRKEKISDLSLSMVVDILG